MQQEPLLEKKVQKTKQECSIQYKCVPKRKPRFKPKIERKIRRTTVWYMKSTEREEKSREEKNTQKHRTDKIQKLISMAMVTDNDRLLLGQ